MKRDKVIDSLIKIYPQAFVDIIFEAFRCKKNEDQLEIMTILFAKQLEAAKRDNSEKQILVSPLMESNPFIPKDSIALDDNPPQVQEEKEKSSIEIKYEYWEENEKNDPDGMSWADWDLKYCFCTECKLPFTWDSICGCQR